MICPLCKNEMKKASRHSEVQTWVCENKKCYYYDALQEEIK